MAWDRQLCLGQWQWSRRGLWQLRETQLGRRGSRKNNETPQARGTAKLGQVASGSTTQGLWLENRKMGSQVVYEDRSQLPGITVGKLGEEEEKPAKERRREHTDLGSDLAERKEHVAYDASALAMTYEACRKAEI